MFSEEGEKGVELLPFDPETGRHGVAATFQEKIGMNGMTDGLAKIDIGD